MPRTAGNAFRTLPIAPILFFAIACSARSPVEGAWKSEERRLVFQGTAFAIEYPDASEVSSLRGRFSMRGSTISLSFEDYRDGDGEWLSLKGAELGDYVERMEVAVTGEKLTTKILATGKVYEYRREPGD